MHIYQIAAFGIKSLFVFGRQGNNGAKNAAILAVQMMGTNDEVMLQKVADLKAEMAS